MPRKRISRNAPCPCGSGKKYKKCCYGKDFDFEKDDQGNVFKSIPMSEEMAVIGDNYLSPSCCLNWKCYRAGLPLPQHFSWPCTVTASRHCDPHAVILA